MFIDLKHLGELKSAKTYVTYYSSLQRDFKIVYKFDIDIFQGGVFSEPTTEIYHVVDNIFKEIQVNGNYTASHNSLTTEDSFALYDSDGLSKDDAIGFMVRWPTWKCPRSEKLKRKENGFMLSKIGLRNPMLTRTNKAAYMQ